MSLLSPKPHIPVYQLRNQFLIPAINGHIKCIKPDDDSKLVAMEKITDAVRYTIKHF